MGLEMFLELSEAVNLSRRLGSVPQLFPLNLTRYPQNVVYFRRNEQMCRSLVPVMMQKLEKERCGGDDVFDVL